MQARLLVLVSRMSVMQEGCRRAGRAQKQLVRAAMLQKNHRLTVLQALMAGKQMSPQLLQLWLAMQGTMAPLECHEVVHSSRVTNKRHLLHL
jgi:hypothetical protein